MAEKKEKSERISWNLVDNNLTMHLGNVTEKFDLSVIFPDFDGFNRVQKMTVKNGVAQKLGDKIARKKGETLSPDEKIAAIKATWKQLIKGEWNTKGISSKVELNQAKEKAQKLMKKGLLSEEAFKTLFPV